MSGRLTRTRRTLRLLQGLVRVVEAALRRLGDPARGRCPWTGGKHVFARFAYDDFARCGCGRSQFA